MKKPAVNTLISLLLLVSTFLYPSLALADAGPMYYDCTSPKMTQSERDQLYKSVKAGSEDIEFYDVDNKVRGTCKKIEQNDSVSIDSIVQKDYFLGTHNPFCFGFHCKEYTKYSEHVSVTSSSTITVPSYGEENKYLVFSLFDKSYFVPLVQKLFKEKGLTFDSVRFNPIEFYLYQKAENNTLKFWYSRDSLPEKTEQNKLIVENNSYKVYTFLYQEYSKYIHAPKNVLIESQYADLEKGSNYQTNKDIGITDNTVAITSPLKSLTRYWLYTKKDSKLTLVWQKTEYTLDDGSVKVVGKDSKLSVGDILETRSHVSPEEANIITKTVTQASSTSSPTPHEKKHVVQPTVSVEDVGFFQRIINSIASLFN